MRLFLTLTAAGALAGGVAAADGAKPAGLKRIALSDQFFCEGATFGDLNNDKKPEVISGPYFYLGPDFKRKFEYCKPEPVDKHGYSKNFFAFTHDFNGDKWLDILILGFPGQDASWYENPKGKDGHWKRNVVFNGVDNESPGFGDLTGDGKPEIICHTGGRLGYAEPDWKDASKSWTFHAISPKGDYQQFTHGLGYGDINGDGKPDLLEKTGWWEQPKGAKPEDLWTKHGFDFSGAGLIPGLEYCGMGGAQMHAFDVDGDKDADVVTSLAAHGWGLAWFEQVKEGGGIGFKPHLIMADTPDKNRYGVKFSQLHAVDCVDMDGDGIKDIVTGKRHWAHGPDKDPEAKGPAVLYWFKVVRTSKGPDFIPHLIDDNSGAGTQVVAMDINGDKRGDVVVGNKMGTFAFVSPGGKAKEPAGPVLFNGKDLDGWEGDAALWKVERGELVGKTETGLPRNEFLRSAHVLDDFRLIVKVKLTPNEANSGIQFRSEAQDGGEVKGYQADIGAGWWGKLYEEHGRAVLWDKSGEEHVKKGEWNTYEILAVGDHVRTALNGRLCVDLTDAPGAKSGILALQVHSGGPTEIRFKEFQLETGPKDEMRTVR